MGIILLEIILFWYADKKKRHTIKTQVVVNKADGQIICTSSTKGRRHDFKLFKGSKLKIDTKIRAVVDTGYVGIAKFHANFVIPVKCSEKRPLAMEDKVFNRRFQVSVS
ncbi:MAG: transposase [Nitrososphaerota archaeon]|nr:transposase [Nitrososphaerota archaeon]